MRLGTRLVHFDAAPGDPHRPVVTPLYQSATFVQPDATRFGEYDYSRSGNPTRAVLERQLAALEGGGHAFAFTSGMAALTAVLRTVSAGEEVVAGLDLYGGTYRLLGRILPRAGVLVRHVDTTDLDAVRTALTPRTRLLLVETPSNPLMEVSDLTGLAELARAAGARLVVDASIMSPVLQRPLEHGADVVVHSATKFLGGHADITAGVVTVRDPGLAEMIYLTQNGEGTALAPFEAWLVLRGLKTLHLRVRQQQETAVELADWLAAHPAVERVFYPGRDGPAGRAAHARQADGPGSVLSFTTGDLAASRRVVEATELFTTCVSFGSVGSTISLPCFMSHASVPPGAPVPPPDLVRVSVGVEELEDLRADLERAIGAARPALPRIARHSMHA